VADISIKGIIVYIGIREARPGMTLAEDIELPKGAGLVQKDKILSEDTIGLLTRSGVTRISIVDHKVAPQGAPIAQKAPIQQPAAAPSASAQAAPAPPPVNVTGPACPPRIAVAIAPDAMSARLIIDPDGPVSEEIEYNTILNALQQQGVFFGINTEMIPDIVERWKANKRHYEFERIAKGSQPEPGKEGAYHIKVHYLSNVADIEAIKKSSYYWQALEKLGTLHGITCDTVVAEKVFDTPPIPGSNVKGEPLITDQVIPTKMTLGEGVAFSQDRSKILAKKPGILYHLSDTIGLLNLNLNGSIDVTVDSDVMTARLTIHSPGEGGGMPSEKEIITALHQARVLWGLDTNAIADLVRGFSEGRYPAQPVIVAQGRPPQNGENGKVDFLFNTTTSLQPKVNPDGSADYKSVNIVISVPKGQELARLNPPSKGTPGKNVIGEDLPCKEGSPGILPIGPNTEPHPDNDDILIASVDGIVRFAGSYVEVCEGYVIKGDVDFSTGNVKYDKSVIINGDIKAGFSVDCGGDLQVSGIIEDCALAVGGNLLCKHGFIGQGKGVIDCKGDVNLGFLLNQTVRSRKSVNVAKEAINSTIFARQSISVHGKPVSVAGGMLVARELISLYTVGNQSGLRTNIEVGLDYTLVEELKKNEEQVAEVSQKSRKVIDSIKKYQHLVTIKKHFTAQEEFLFNKLRLAMAKIEEQLRLLEERKKIIQTKMSELENAMIKIEHSAMPGTMFKIGDRRFVVKEEIIGPKTVRLIRQEIHIL
jgi:uncharacterized protein (DUF342 family)